MSTLPQSEAKHTEGPWRFDDDGEVRAYHEDGDLNDNIAVVYYPENGPLIAAAPELLEELEQQADGCSTIIGLLSTHPGAVAASLVTMLRYQEANARFMIAKARGES